MNEHKLQFIQDNGEGIDSGCEIKYFTTSTTFKWNIRS